MNLIWQTPLKAYMFEHEWLKKIIFSKITVEKEFFDFGTLQTVCDNAIIIYTRTHTNISPQFNNYLSKFKGKRFFLYHLSNENLKHNAHYYNEAIHVFRTYEDQEISNQYKNVTTMPLGFQSGYFNLKQIINTEDRQYDAAFIGQVKSDRQEVVNVLQNIPNIFLHLTKQWNCPTALSIEEVSQIYKNCKYVPCPKGWIHPDSFRICEALEWGAIPILKNYPNQPLGWLFEDHPLPIVQDWKEIPFIINNTDFKKLQAKCIEWYQQLKSMYSNIVYNQVN
jgi:hypothetical protein